MMIDSDKVTAAFRGDDGSFDVVCFFDCLHDMGDPIGIARHVKEQLVDGGTVMLVEPFAHDTRVENHQGMVGGFLYGASTFFLHAAPPRRRST